MVHCTIKVEEHSRGTFPLFFWYICSTFKHIFDEISFKILWINIYFME